MIALSFAKSVTTTIIEGSLYYYYYYYWVWDTLVGMYMVEIGEICAGIPPTHGFNSEAN